MEKTLPELLMEARDMLDIPQHWTKGDWHNEHHSRHCMEGALLCSMSDHHGWVGNDRLVDEAILTVEMALRLRGWGMSITTFNDVKAKNLNEVRDVFDDAIRLAKLREGFC